MISLGLWNDLMAREHSEIFIGQDLLSPEGIVYRVSVPPLLALQDG